MWISWLEKHLLPCAYKSIFGIDCPGCGFQRSVIALLKGNFTESLTLYPATIPVLLTSIFLLVEIKYQFTNRKAIKRVLFTVTLLVIIISYGIKMWGVYARYKASAAAVI